MLAWIVVDVVAGTNTSVTPSVTPWPAPSPQTSEPPPTPLCDQEQLISVATTISKLELKKQCEAAIEEPEMLKTGDPKAVCGVSSCVDALQHLYETLPKCLFRDWDVQLHAEMLLRNCGIEPEDGANDCSYDDLDDGSTSDDSSSGSIVGVGSNDSYASQSMTTADDHHSNSYTDDDVDE